MKATVKLYHDRRDDYSDVEPDQQCEIEITTSDNNRLGMDVDFIRDPANAADVWDEADNPHNHKYYAIDVECDEPVTLNVHTNDNIHNPCDWSRPVESGLYFHPDDNKEPFGCELWGSVTMWVEYDG